MNPLKTQKQTVFYHEMPCTLATISSATKGLPEKLMAEAQRLGLKQTGALSYLYYDVDGKPDRLFKLHIAIPVMEASQTDTHYRFRELEEISYVKTEHKGAWSTLAETYERFMADIAQSGLNISSHCREWYTHMVSPESDENITEIQIEVFTK